MRRTSKRADDEDNNGLRSTKNRDVENPTLPRNHSRLIERSPNGNAGSHVKRDGKTRKNVENRKLEPAQRGGHQKDEKFPSH